MRGSKIFIPDPYLDFLPIPDPGFRGEKVPDPGSGSAMQEKKDCVQEENECEGIQNIHPGSGSFFHLTIIYSIH